MLQRGGTSQIILYFLHVSYCDRMPSGVFAGQERHSHRSFFSAPSYYIAKIDYVAKTKSVLLPPHILRIRLRTSYIILHCLQMFYTHWQIGNKWCEEFFHLPRYLIDKRENVGENAWLKAKEANSHPPSKRTGVTFRDEFYSLPDSRRNISRNNPRFENACDRRYVWNR